MLAVMLVAPSRLEIATVPLPALIPGHVLIRTSFVGLCGADAAMFTGSSVYLRDGLKRYPFVPGHEWSGVVADAADNVAGLSPGQRVAGHNFITCGNCSFCRAGRRTQCINRSEMGILGTYPGAASEYFAVPAEVLCPLPDEVPDRTAALLEPGSTALHATDRVGVREDDLVAVFGTGALGLLALQICKVRGARVHAIGVDPAGLHLADELGADEVLRPEDAPSDEYSVVIEASGATRAIARAGHVLAYGGRLALVGIAHTPVDQFPAAQLVIKNANVQAVLSGIEHWDRLIGLVARRAVRLDPLLDQIFPLTDAKQAFMALLTPNRARPKIMLAITR